MKQTENYIWNSFLNSGKKHLILTGSRGSGKSTIFQGLCRYLQEEALQGITTYMIPEKCVILRVNDTGEEREIGRFDRTAAGRPMRPVPSGFTELGCPALKRMADGDGKWIAMDELGFLESGELLFQAAVREGFDRKRVLAVLRKQETSFLEELKARGDVFLVDLDDYQRKVGCVIMASGKSVRFGENKLFAELEGKSFLQWVLETTADIFAERVVVTRSKEAVDYCRKQGVDVIFHEMPHRSDTVRLGTEYMEHMDGILFCPCDQPLLQRESLFRMRNAFSFENKELLRLVHEEQAGMPALFAKAYYEELKSLPEGKGGSFLLKKYADKIAEIPVTDRMELFDIDTKEELEKLKKVLLFSDGK